MRNVNTVKKNAAAPPTIKPFSFAFPPAINPPINIATKAVVMTTHCNDCSVSDVKETSKERMKLAAMMMRKIVITPKTIAGKKRCPSTSFTSH